MYQLIIYCLTIWFGIINGYSRFRYEIPNGLNVTDPCGKRELWSAVGHMGPSYTPRKNLFGQDVSKMVRAGPFDWRQVCGLDSDGDGLTNGQELGDPNCAWQKGADAILTSPIGHPGFCEPHRAQCGRGASYERCPNPKDPEGQSFTRRTLPKGANEHPQTTKTKTMIGGRGINRLPMQRTASSQIWQPPTQRFPQGGVGMGTSIFGEPMGDRGRVQGGGAFPVDFTQTAPRQQQWGQPNFPSQTFNNPPPIMGSPGNTWQRMPTQRMFTNPSFQDPNFQGMSSGGFETQGAFRRAPSWGGPPQGQMWMGQGLVAFNR